MIKEFPNSKIIEGYQGDNKDCFRSITLEGDNNLSKLEGTVQWICNSPFRPNHKRKNWYIDISIIPDKDSICDTEEFKVEAFYSRGKGGQNVNKTDSAVRVTHIPTGISVKCDEERSQYMNKIKAMVRIRSELKRLDKNAEALQIKNSWNEHYRIIRGNPVRTYEGKEFKRRK